MTREQWALILGEWCQILGITAPPTLVFLPARRMPPGVAMLTEWYLALENGWQIKVSTGDMDDPERTLVHELLHVKSGCTDQCHEPWIRDLAAALVALKRRAC